MVVVWGNVAQLGGASCSPSPPPCRRSSLAFTLLGISFGVGWPGFNALTSSIVSGPLRTQFFGINFALVNLGIGIGGIVSGFLTDVDRPGTFTAIFLVDAACILVPIGLLLGPLRHVAGRPERAPAGAPVEPGTGYLAILRNPAVLWITALTFLSSFVGYGQMEAGFPAFARQVSEVSTRTIGLAFAANTLVIVGMQFLVLRVIDGHRRTRVFLGLVGLWAAAWLLLGATGMVAGTLPAAAGVIVFHVLFGLGETMLQPTVPAIVNDLASDRDRGRFNAVSAGAFQVGAITAPIVAGLAARAGSWAACSSASSSPGWPASRCSRWRSSAGSPPRSTASSTPTRIGRRCRRRTEPCADLRSSVSPSVSRRRVRSPSCRPWRRGRAPARRWRAGPRRARPSRWSRRACRSPRSRRCSSR